MQLSQLMRPGDKIDVKMVQQLEKEKTNGENTKALKSSVFDITDNEELEITMPTDGGKMILLPMGVRFSFLFYTHNGMFESKGIVKKRYKKENFYILLVELLTAPQKIQRREYFRMECVLEMNYYVVTEDVFELETTQEIITYLKEKDFYNNVRKGAILDISGGGVRFVSKEQLEADSFLLIVVRLSNDKMNQQFHIISQIVSSERSVKKAGLYENRVKFFFKDPKVREAIISYIFEEERRNRKKENG